eukprot:TRINITY_DN32569_c0_g1_i1.p1 TRINITY_DN32569_c0_g1~~TRINITY_DN32569_c0_g1_i1.p1  ORF type:complete len:499 (+),score=32.82 TRINITY_DN32569_c0_g1_i1:203-1498(+)
MGAPGEANTDVQRPRRTAVRPTHVSSCARSTRFTQRISKRSSETLTKLFVRGSSLDLSRLERNMLSTCLKQIWKFLEDENSSRLATVYHSIIFILILLRVTAYYVPLTGIETFDASVCVVTEVALTVELLARCVSCPHISIFCMNKLLLAFDFACCLPLATRAVVEMSSVRPSFDIKLMELFFPVMLLLKLLRRFDQIHLVNAAIRNSWEALPMMIFLLWVIVCSFSALIYMAEPRSEVALPSDAMWMVIVTVSTVGYGDMYPVTRLGRVITASLIGVSTLYLTIPVGIVGNAFKAAWEDRDRLMMMREIHARIIRSAFSPKDMDKICQNMEDDDIVTFADFVELLSLMELPCSHACAHKIYSFIDEDGDGDVSLRELLTCLFPSYKRGVRQSQTESCGSSGGLDSSASGDEDEGEEEEEATVACDTHYTL